MPHLSLPLTALGSKRERIDRRASDRARNGGQVPSADRIGRRAMQTCHLDASISTVN
jgi:hypothetical protein